MDNLVVKEKLTNFVDCKKEETFNRIDTELCFMESEIKDIEHYMNATIQTISDSYGSEYSYHYMKELKFLKETCRQITMLIETFKQLEEVQEAINNL